MRVCSIAFASSEDGAALAAPAENGRFDEARDTKAEVLAAVDLPMKAKALRDQGKPDEAGPADDKGKPGKGK